MFKFIDRYEFDWPVTVRYPGADGAVEDSFTARFLLIDEDEFFSARPAEARDIREIIADDRARMARVLLGWDGIATEDGKPLPFTPENRDRLLGQRPIREAVARAYNAAMIGVVEKN